MKIVLSRKGFDASSGGVPSPILPDGRLLTLPIPDSRSPIRYRECRDGGFDLGSLVHSLTKGRVRGRSRVHLDPDLDSRSRKRPEGFHACLGQCGSAARHLERHAVGVGDLFLFFGWFRAVEAIPGKAGAARFRYQKHAPDLHVIFGWLQVGRVFEETERWPACTGRHPHRFGQRPAPNRLYLATERLCLQGESPGLPGAGRFPELRDELVLTAPGRSRSVWMLPPWCFPRAGAAPFSYHEQRSRWRRTREGVELRSVARGQEFVLDTAHFPDATAWCASLLSGSARS